MKHYLYILKSKKVQRIYIGITANIQKRLKKHNVGLVRSTKAYRPWILQYTEEFPDKTSARKREIQLKKNYQARKELLEKF